MRAVDGHKLSVFLCLPASDLDHLDHQKIVVLCIATALSSNSEVLWTKSELTTRRTHHAAQPSIHTQDPGSLVLRPCRAHHRIAHISLSPSERVYLKISAELEAFLRTSVQTVGGI